ncbi:MAG: hypothetical protein QM756_23060 [Polyangiaceae bacterium]
MPAPISPKIWTARLEKACHALSFALPWLLGVWNANPNPTFASDLTLVRAFGLLPVGFEGQVSAAFSALFALLPLGGLALRSAFVSAFGLGCGAWLTYRLARGFVERRGASGSWVGPLSLLAALGATVGPSWLLEGSSAGGHALVAALVLGSLEVAEPTRWSARRALVVGGLLGATFLESRWTGLGALLALGLRRALSSSWPARREWAALLAGVVALLSLPLLSFVSFVLSPSPQAGMALGASSNGFSVTSAAVEHSAALSAWLAEMGLVGLLLSLVGVGLSLINAEQRRIAVPYLVFLGLDLALRAQNLEPTRHDPMWGIRLVALSGLSAASALSLSALLAWSARARIVFARPAGILMVVYGVTLVLVSLEDSAGASEAREQGATQQWTEAALSSLPPHSVLLIRSEAVLFRLLAAQATRGSRPDVLVVPFELLERGGARAAWLARERGLLPLVREMLLKGEPSEFALSALADARPTFVELGAVVEQRLASHLVPRPFFTEFASQPLARSDRREGLERGQQSLSRVASALKKCPDGDPATRSLLAQNLAERALLLASLGDREASAELVNALRALDPSSSIVASLGSKLSKPGKGRIDVRALLATR